MSTGGTNVDNILVIGGGVQTLAVPVTLPLMLIGDTGYGGLVGQAHLPPDAYEDL